MAKENLFLGTWEISECTLNGQPEMTALKGIKFRLDEMGDITWYNDLVNPMSDENNFDSANALLNCETFEILDVFSDGPTLLFGAFDGHNIEFKTEVLSPGKSMKLSCEGWYTLVCKRLRDCESREQDVPFSFLLALNQGFFHDGYLKSSEGHQFCLHSTILRLSGFECNMTYPGIIINGSDNRDTTQRHDDSRIQISVTAPAIQEIACDPSPRKPSFLLSAPLQLLPSASLDTLKLPLKQAGHYLSSSFHCLVESKMHDHSLLTPPACQKTYFSSSDSSLQTCNVAKNIFNFNECLLNPIDNRQKSCKSPLSPYRCKSPWLCSSFLETPPSSPLTPLNVLQNLPYFLLKPILQWLYAECLPSNLDEDTCEKLITLASNITPLNKMMEPCRQYLKLIRLKKYVIDIITEIHCCLNRITASMKPATCSRKPENLCEAVKFAACEAAVGCAKVLQLCNIFVKDGAGMSRYQRHEVIKYVKSQLPTFLAQAHQFLQNVLAVLTNLTEEEKTELIIYLVPETEATLSLMTDVISEVKMSLERVCTDLSKNSSADASTTEATCDDQQDAEQQQRVTAKSDDVNTLERGRRLKRLADSEHNFKFVLYIYEVKKLRDIYGRVSTALDIIEQKRIAYCEMNDFNREQTLRQNFDQLIVNIHTYILIIQNISNSFDGRVGWKEFKFCFKLAASQVNGILANILSHKSALSPAIMHICMLVDRPKFTQTMIALDLLDKMNDLRNHHQIDDDNNKFRINCDYNTKKMNLTKYLSESPNAAQSSLSKNALRLLHSGQLTDMEFEVFGSGVTAATTNDTTEHLVDTNELDNKVHTFRAHRVIVGSRCEWFNKALSSGMQESINRKIVVPDTSPVIFRRLLLYLYGAPVDKTVGAESICELMLLADRFSVDALKDICEATLKSQIDEDSALCLLSIADRFNTSTLKASCFSFISQHPGIAKSDMFSELPNSLQSEVHDLIQWCGRVPEPWNDRPPGFCRTKHSSLKSPSRSPRTRCHKIEYFTSSELKNAFK